MKTIEGQKLHSAKDQMEVDCIKATKRSEIVSLLFVIVNSLPILNHEPLQIIGVVFS